MTNWNIIGHHRQLEQLEADITRKNLAHAYLFTGPSNIGKFTIAKKFAQKIQCPNQGCDACPTCIQIKKGQHFDTIQLLDDGNKIKISDLRAVIERVNLSNQGNYTLILIDNADRMTRETSNCLLKTLEEPPKQTIFILTSAHAHQLLDTITSRARLLNFTPQPDQIIAAQLREKSIPNENIELITTLACGKPGKAISLNENPDQLESIKEHQSNIDAIFNKSPLAERFRYIKVLSENPESLNEFLTIFTLTLHRKIRENPTPQYQNILQASQKIPRLLNHNINTRLLLENLLLSI